MHVLRTLLICSGLYWFYALFVLCSEFWPRLIVDEQKPAWLKVNFDRWQSEDTSDSEKDELEEQAKLEVNEIKHKSLLHWLKWWLR